jgi:hypothetical protein
MKRFLLVASTLFTISAFAQEASSGGSIAGYQRAFGVKFSSGVAASYKQFVGNTKSLEAEAMFFNEGIRLIGLYEFNFPIQGVNGLNWYVGPGAHVGFYRKTYSDKYNTAADIGIDGVIGLDYKIPSIPINLSLDWQPSYSILGSAGLSPQFGGLGIRYTFQ